MIKYEISRNLNSKSINKWIVWQYTETENSYGIKGVYSARTRKECEEWLKVQKKNG